MGIGLYGRHGRPQGPPLPPVIKPDMLPKSAPRTVKSRARGAFFRDPIQTGALSVEQLGGDSKDGGPEAPSLVVLRGMGTGKGGNRNRSVKQTCQWHVCSVGRSGFAAGREPSQGPAGGMTRKQVSKRVTWKALQPGIRRADVGIGPYAEER